jgi:hypothetical protein
MNKTELAPGIVIYSDVIKNFKSLTSDIESAVDSKIVRWKKAGIAANNGLRLDEKVRDSDVIGIPYTNNSKINFSNPISTFLTSFSGLLYSSCSFLEKDYCDSYNFSTTRHESYNILKYSVGQKFTNHIDDHRDKTRRVSTIYFINDSYSGGEVEFPRFNILYKPIANQLLVFPSNYVYNHSIKEVTKGTRYSVVSWMS